MLFHFLNFSQCVECMFGHKTIYKVTNLKVHSKGRYFVLKNPFSRTTTNGSFGLQSCFPVFVISQIVNPAYGNSNVWGGGENAWLSSARFKILTRCGCFYITVFLKETNCLQKILDVNFISSCM